ncbi:MAG: hypothetical protein QM758_05145 [Armatimonas sp.]
MSGIVQASNGKVGIGFIQLTIHLTSGGKQQFLQTDPELAEALLEHLRPERIFTQPQILIAGTDAVTVLAADSVERIDLCSDPLPDWPHRVGITDIHEILEEDFQRIQRREHKLPSERPVPGSGNPPPPLELGVAAELRSGAVAHMSVHPRPPQNLGDGVADTPLTPDDARAFLRHLFDRSVVFGRMEENAGVFLINPANAVRFVLTPPPPVQSLPSVWPMNRM